MDVFNRDINPLDVFAATYARLEFFVRNPPVAEAFAAAERKAVFWKRLHTWAGRISLVCVLLVMWTLAYDLTIASLFQRLPWLDSVIAVFGAVGLLAQLVLILGGLKDRWLLARFAAERLRCLKFEAFAVVAEQPDALSAAGAGEAFTREAIANLAQEMMGGRAAMSEFRPKDVLARRRRTGAGHDPDLITEAETVYERLRLDVQIQHFEARARRAREADRFPATLAEVTFILGAAIAFIDVIIAGRVSLAAQPRAETLMLWLHFATWSLFATSAVVAIYQRGAARRSDAERYERFAREIGHIRARYPRGTAAGFAEAVHDMECVALQELEEFCRDADQSSYVF